MTCHRQGLDYKAAEKWITKLLRKTNQNLGLNDLHTVVLPINSGNSHWYLASVNPKLKKISLYDSLSNRKSKKHLNTKEFLKTLKSFQQVVKGSASLG
jgi:Ulp1 family protease